MAFYAIGVSPSSFGGDSGDIILSYYFGNVAHPPGYPLNTMLGWTLSRAVGLVSGGTFAYKANMVSAVYMALSCALLYLLTYRLLKNKLYSLYAAFTLGFATLFWLYAHSAEVFQLTILLILISFNFLFAWFYKPKNNQKKAYLAIFFFGLAVFHHQTALLFGPSYIYLIHKRRKYILNSWKEIFKIIFIFLLGLLPYLYVGWETLIKNPHNWEDAGSVENFIRLLARSDYGTFSATKELVGTAITTRLLQLLWYFKFVIEDFSILGVLLALLGTVYLFFKKREIFWFFFLAWFFGGPFFVFYASFPMTESFYKGVVERFLINSYLAIAIFTAFGVGAIIFFIQKLFWVRLRLNKVILKVLAALFLIIPFSLAYANYPRADLSGYKVGRVIAEDILSSADPSGIVFLQSDTLLFNTQYSNLVEKTNEQSKVIIAGMMGKPTYRKNIVRLYPDLNYPEVFYSTNRLFSGDVGMSLIEANIDRYPIYSFEELPLGDKFVFVKEGMLYRIYRKDEAPSNEEVERMIAEKIAKLKFTKSLTNGQYLHFFADNIIVNYPVVFNQNGFELLSRGKVDEAERYFLRALDLDPKFKPALFNLGIVYSEQKKCGNAKSVFENLRQIDENYWQALEGLGHVYKNCYDNSDKAQSYFDAAEKLKNKDFSVPLEKF